MMRIFLLLIYLGLSSTNEHWFVFDQNQFPGFNIPLFTLISSTNNSTTLSFTLSTYERSIHIEHSNDELVKLNIERADILSNTFHHLIFIAVRDQTKFETYVNCKLIDSYLLYTLNENSSYQIENLTDGIKYFETTIDQLFDQYACKHISPIIMDNNQTTTIGKPLIRKMQHVIEKVQVGKQRSKRHQHQPSTSDSMTIIYKPNISHSESHIRTIINISQFAFHIRYSSIEHLFHIQFDNENRSQLILYADKSTDRNSSSTMVLFLRITPITIHCYLNCELTDQEFLADSAYVQNIIRQTMGNQGKRFVEYDRQSTLILFNKSIDQIATEFFCSKLDQKNEDLLPDKYALRKFVNALDILIDNLDAPLNDELTTPNISTVNIHSINGFGSLLAPSLNTMPNEIHEYDRTCFTDQDCSSNNSLLKCQYGHCICPTRYFWSSVFRRCLVCKDLSIGNRCFRLSNHKSTWYDANDYCRHENSLDEQQEYTMKLASNLNRTDIELLKQSLIHEDNGEQLDYFYWIGSTSHLDTRNTRTKRRVLTTIFRWYDTGETAQFNLPTIWCSQREPPLNNNNLCVSLTSCGLYADDCQRNYRFICEAV